ncbi:MAG: phosphatase PAP2 family protein [Bacteroidales bacterium]
MDYLIHLDEKLFVFLNGIHSPFFDTLMEFITHKFTWIPLYVVFLIMGYFALKKRVWLLLLGVIITIVLADQASVHLFKNVFMRLRPCHNPELESVIHLVNGKCGGLYGFVSSHAANTFGLATFLFLVFRKHYKYIWWVFIWAALVSYSRIYLGRHYPGDILCGAILGVVVGYISSFVMKIRRAK